MAGTGNFASTIQGHLEPNGFQQITSVAAATGITAPDGTKVAMIQVTTQNVRWRDDGTNPTTTIGMRLIANDILVYSGVMSAIKFIEETGSAVLNITYYK